MEKTSRNILAENLREEFHRIESSLNGSATSSFHKVRRSAMEAFVKAGFPTLRNEEWRFTNLSFLDKINFSLSDEKNVDDELKAAVEKYKHYSDCDTIVIINGYYCEQVSELSENFMSVIQVIGNTNIPSGEFVDDIHENPFVNLNTALSGNRVIINTKANQTISRTLHVLYVNDSRESAVMSMPRLELDLGENSRIKIIESNHTLGDNPSFINSLLKLTLEKQAKADTYKMQNDSDHSYFISNVIVEQDRESVFHNNTLSLGGKFVRNDLISTFRGEYAESNFNGFYFLDQNNFVDNHTLADHAVPNCLSNELYKGILDDESRAVFNGKIMVRKDAQKTNAYQTNRNILLTDNAKVNTKPQLEIYADDVKCSHGATSGNLNEEELFYLRTRGIGEDKARALLLNAFAGEVIMKINIESLKEEIAEQVEKRLSI